MGRGEDATITIYMLGLCVAVLFLGGLSLDLWRAFAERRDLATLVDGAAVAAASAIDEEAFREHGVLRLDPDLAAAVACDYLHTSADPPAGCDGVVATPEAVVVTADRDVTLTLIRVLLPGQPPLEIQVTARAEPHGSG